MAAHCITLLFQVQELYQRVKCKVHDMRRFLYVMLGSDCLILPRINSGRASLRVYSDAWTLKAAAPVHLLRTATRSPGFTPLILFWPPPPPHFPPCQSVECVVLRSKEAYYRRYVRVHCCNSGVGAADRSVIALWLSPPSNGSIKYRGARWAGRHR